MQLAGTICVSSMPEQLLLEEPHVLIDLLLKVDLSLCQHTFSTAAYLL